MKKGIWKKLTGLFGALTGLFLLLATVGAINWGLVGAFDFNLVSYLFGAWSWLENLIYILVGVSGLALLVTGPALLVSGWKWLGKKF